MKLTRKSLKRGQREPVSPVAGDADDLYRRYLRIKAEKSYFREFEERSLIRAQMKNPDHAKPDIGPFFKTSPPEDLIPYTCMLNTHFAHSSVTTVNIPCL